MDRTELIGILDREVDYYSSICLHYRSRTTAIVGIGLASIIALLALINGKSISFSTPLIDYVPFYSSVILISYGFYTLFKWYDLQSMKAFKARSEEYRKEGDESSFVLGLSVDPYSVLMRIFTLIGGLAVFVGFLMMPQYSQILSIILFAALVVFYASIILRKPNDDEGSHGTSLELGAFEVLSQNRFYYLVAFFFMSLGILFLVAFSNVFTVDKMVFAIYIAEIEVVMIVGLNSYRVSVLNLHRMDSLMDLRFKLIHDRVTTEEALVIHSKIFSCETNNQLIARKESGI